jgi:hypothetical protein
MFILPNTLGGAVVWNIEFDFFESEVEVEALLQKTAVHGFA